MKQTEVIFNLREKLPSMINEVSRLPEVVAICGRQVTGSRFSDFRGHRSRVVNFVNSSTDRGGSGAVPP
jgi:hypothetical protein